MWSLREEVTSREALKRTRNGGGLEPRLQGDDIIIITSEMLGIVGRA